MVWWKRLNPVVDGHEPYRGVFLPLLPPESPVTRCAAVLSGKTVPEYDPADKRDPPRLARGRMRWPEIAVTPDLAMAQRKL